MTAHDRTLTAAAVLAAMMTASATYAGSDRLTVKIGGLDRSGHLPDQAAFCPPASSATKNISPAVKWSAGPNGTRSYALLMVDPDVPQDFSQINKAGTVISTDAARITLHHWVLVDIPTTIRSLSSGVESEGLVPHGKPVGETGHGRRGANVYTSFLASNPEMAGTYGGYDGPCPPVNDERPHDYVVKVFALDVPSLRLTGAFDGPSAEKAMHDHVLAQGEAIATYTLNPRLMGQPSQ
ncbi:MAG: YbhB/YbcL family Raf kinase inhibitor-like protein [Azospirillaceae bacterium]|nr:YbhB/YbcL family Raf kinase inhibitor-like protein [Azospirillaceae bacterium]